MADTTYPYQDGDFTILGPECFTDGAVIWYRGENYYRACNEFVYEPADGGQAFCVRRVGHHGDVHEAYDGVEVRKVKIPQDLDGS